MVHKFFLKRLQRYIISMMIPTIIIFIISLFMFLKTTEKELRVSGEQTVDAVKTNFEVVISNVLYQNDLLSNTTRMSVALKKILAESDMAYSDAIYISVLRSVLDSITNSHDYIDSIYFYLDSYQRYFSSQEGIKNLKTSSDISWLSYYENMEDELDSLVVTRNQHNTIEKMETISIFQRLLLQKGCIVVNIDIDKFKEMLKSICANEYETVFIMDNSGNILLKETTGKEDTEALSTYLQNIGQDYAGDMELALKGKTDNWLKVSRASYLLSFEKYEEKNIYIISAISSKAHNPLIWNMIRTFLLIMLANCCIIAFLSYLITHRTFEQIQYMINVFDDAEKGIFTHNAPSKIRDEYDIIMNNVIHMFINTTYLNTQLKEKQYRQEATELKALQLQINPHFLYNTLQTLELEVRKNNTNQEEISHIIQAVSDILKYSLSDPQENVSVEKEIKYLKKYIDIQQFRFGNQFIIYYEIEEDILNARVFKLMLQPIVENCLLHGIRNLGRTGYIKIKIFKINQYLKCIVTDNGIGMSKNAIKALYEHINNEQSRSIGLTNVNRRLILKYGKDSKLKIRAKENWGTSISFMIPYEEGNQ